MITHLQFYHFSSFLQNRLPVVLPVSPYFGITSVMQRF